MFSVIYNTLANLEIIKSHTAILSLLSFIKERWTIEGDEVEYINEDLPPMNITEEQAIKIINKINSMGEIQLIPTILKEFVQYYLFWLRLLEELSWVFSEA